MSDLNGSGGHRPVQDLGTPWPALGPDSGPQPVVPAQATAPQGSAGREHDAQPWDIVERLRQMADLIGDALAAGERKVAEVSTELGQLQQEKESAQRDAAAAWGEVQRARGQAEQADRRA
ncbi:MAG TPA: hypothetical protein VHJ17_11425, partial [Thermomonospora sp.]|nr:hypothetical protein [Thermomonospora sp.]